jgi:aspartate aminotransferase-like enzyme/GNAT superfamily N-acetyltransferase
MSIRASYTFRVAASSDEIEQVLRLNYQTFVRELGQYADDGSERLVDKFHDKNRYLVGMLNGEVVGMLCVHDRPPFSIAARLPDPSILTTPGSRPLEVRLLAIRPEHRRGSLFAGLGEMLFRFARDQGYTQLLISGVVQQVPLYEHLGFQRLGPAVPCGAAEFVPMSAEVANLEARHGISLRRWTRRQLRSHAVPTVSLLPGPVPLSAAVKHAFAEPPVYHRDHEFIDLFASVRNSLGRLVGGRDVAVLVGSGTLANDTVAAVLSALPSEPNGLVLVNGEFGERLVRQARRFGLTPRVLRWEWGEAWNLAAIKLALDSMRPGDWVWGVHLETSTGVLNDLPGLLHLCRPRGLRVCLDAMSSCGAVPLDFSQVFAAAATSGKSLGAVAGLAFVFADEHELRGLNHERVPTYLDLFAALTEPGSRFTIPSPLVKSLAAALETYLDHRAPARYEHYQTLSAHLRTGLRRAGLIPLAAERFASPVVTTFRPPVPFSAAEFLERCGHAGFQIGGQSEYLARRGLVQVATMGATARTDVDRFLDFALSTKQTPLLIPG